MSGNKQQAWCWDTCVFLAWFSQEDDKDLDTIDLAIKDIEANKVLIFVPAIVVHEVLVDSNGSSDTSAFKDFLKRDNVQPVSVDFRVAELGAKIRQESIYANKNRKKNKPKKIQTPDALILATAVVYGVSALHTFDSGMLAARGSRSLLGLTIEEPISVTGQRALGWQAG